MKSRTIKIFASLAVVVICAGALVYSSAAEAEFFKHVDEVTADPTRFENRTLKIHGHVAPGSIEENIVDQSTQRTFVLEYNGRRILVRNEGPKPDTFRDLAEVVARGTLLRDGDQYVFEATELMAKCPSKYEQNQRTSSYGKQPEQPE